MDGGAPWRDGNYRGEGFIDHLLVTGREGVLVAFPDLVMTFTLGDFGEADSEVADISGEKVYTVQMKVEIMGKERVTLAVLTDEGKKFYFKSSIKTIPVGFLEWMTKEEADFRASDGDPIQAPPSHYKLEPERRGKLVWITGAPGLGKSTTAQLLSRDHGFVFYEGDFSLMALSELQGLADALKWTNCRLVAVSTDSVAAHEAFATTCPGLRGLDITFVADRAGEIARSCQLYDAGTHSAVPATLLVDEEGEVMALFSSCRQVGGDPAEVARVVAACQDCDSQDSWSWSGVD